MTRDKRIISIRFSTDDAGLALEITSELGAEIVHERFWLGTACTAELLTGLESALVQLRPQPLAAAA